MFVVLDVEDAGVSVNTCCLVRHRLSASWTSCHPLKVCRVCLLCTAYYLGTAIIQQKDKDVSAIVCDIVDVVNIFDERTHTVNYVRESVWTGLISSNLSRRFLLHSLRPGKHCLCTISLLPLLRVNNTLDVCRKRNNEGLQAFL